MIETSLINSPYPLQILVVIICLAAGVLGATLVYEAGWRFGAWLRRRWEARVQRKPLNPPRLRAPRRRRS